MRFGFLLAAWIWSGVLAAAGYPWAHLAFCGCTALVLFGVFLALKEGPK